MADKDDKKPEDKKEEKPAPKDNLVETQHTVQIGGKEIRYTVTAGTIILKEETPDREKEAEGEKPRAQVFFVAYTKDGNGSTVAGSAQALRKRPLTFSFNGGPGSSSVWLHLGVLGPRRVVLQDDGNLPKPPYELSDNEYSLLDQTDLVFIDPMNTGYSRPVEGMKPKEWHGFKKDMPYILFLPGYTATAWYHDMLQPHKPLQTWLKEAEEFALGDYAKALLKGDAISKEEREQIIDKVAMYTGVSKQFVERSKLRIHAFHY